MKRHRVLFVVTDDWFFVSHFLPMARAAKEAGYEISIAGHMNAHAQELIDEGYSVHNTNEKRAGGLIASLRLVWRLNRIMRTIEPDVVHLIALRSILLGGLARTIARRGKAVLAVTGLGYLDAASNNWKRGFIFAFVRMIGRGHSTRYLFENTSDPAILNLPAAQRNSMLIVGGAGINPQQFHPQAMPGGPTLKLALVARMIWSKGIDLAIEAVRQARKSGLDVTLSLYGDPDGANPASLTQAQLVALDGTDGIRWFGRSNDINAVWATHHACILPSRGGEGLPRSLLEAAACGRPMITTAVPGCRDFVRDATDGYVVAPDNAAALAEAIAELDRSRADLEQMGRNARDRVLDGYTEAAVGHAVVNLYNAMLSPQPERG